MELSSITFQPQMLSATIDGGSGVLSYSVNGSAPAGQGSAANGNVSDIANAIGLLGVVMPEYDRMAQAMAVRMALQGGLSGFAQGIRYDAGIDKYVPTTDRQLVPMLEAIFRAAPGSNDGGAIDDYLARWNEILWQVYPDYRISGGETLSGGAMAFDQAFILQQVIAAFEATGLNYDIRRVPSRTWLGKKSHNDNGLIRKNAA